MQHSTSRRKKFNNFIKIVAIPDDKVFTVFIISANRAFLTLKIVLFWSLRPKFSLLILANLIFDCRYGEIINKRF